MSRDFNIDQIKKLWILDLVIQFESLKKASLQAKVTASAVSQTITSLEKLYGKPLLIREKGSILPTQEALSILSIVRPAFDVFAKLKDINGAPIPKINWLNFGTYESLAIDLLPGLVESLRQKLPNIRLGLRISRTSQLLTMVRKGELCSALITECDDLDRFYVKTVAEDRMGFYISKRQAISDLGWGAITKLGYGSLSPSKEGLPRYYSKFLRVSDLGKPSLISDSFETLRALAVSGVMGAILPNRVATRNDDLVEVIPSASAHKTLSDVSTHKILIVSQLSCDRVETDFIAFESTRILNSRR